MIHLPITGIVNSEVEVIEIVVEDLRPNDDGYAYLNWGSSATYLSYQQLIPVYDGAWLGYVNIPGVPISIGSHLVKYDVVSVDSGAGAFDVNYDGAGSGVAGEWYGLRNFHIALEQAAQPSPLAIEDATLDFTVAENNGASPQQPVPGTEKYFRARFVAYKGVNDYLVNDTFTNAAETNLTAHTPDIQVVSPGGWVAHAGVFKIGPTGTYAVADGTSRYVTDAGTANASIKAQILRAMSSNFGLIARAQDASNYWLLLVDDASTSDPVLKLIEVNAGVETIRDSFALTGLGPLNSIAASGLRLLCNGNNIKGQYLHHSQVVHYVNREVTYTSASFNTETKFGIYGEGTGSPLATSRFNGIYITDMEIGVVI